MIGAKRGGQPTAAPVGGSALRATTGPLQNARFEFCCVRPHFATLMAGDQFRPTECGHQNGYQRVCDKSDWVVAEFA
jgi:hypothetical protein